MQYAYAYLSNALCMHARGHAGAQPPIFDSRLLVDGKKVDKSNLACTLHFQYRS